MPNLIITGRSALRRPSAAHTAAKIGAKIKMKAGLIDCVWAAVMVRSIHHTRSNASPEASSIAREPMNSVWSSIGIRIGCDSRARLVLRSANRLSELPACSNRVQNTTDPSISTSARPIWRRSRGVQRRAM